MQEVQNTLAIAIQSLRDQLKGLGKNSFHLEIIADGRLNEGEAKVTFKLYLDYAVTLEGGNLQALIDEVKRHYS